MNDSSMQETQSEERLLAAFSYFFGAIVALIVWALQKDKSRFVRFQALQALAFDLLVMLLSFVLAGCLMAVMFGGMFASMFGLINSNHSQASPPLFLLFPTMFPFLMMICVFPLSFLVLAARIIAAVSVLGGRDFYFPWLGKQLKKFLGESI